MSHFTVMVFGENPEQQLAPYDENLENVENPKWDWYALGGRWSGFFKEIGTGIHKDVIKKSDIDIDGMKNDLMATGEKQYDEVIGIINKWVNSGYIKNIPISWERYKELIARKYMTVDEARESYHSSQTYIKDLRNAGYGFFTKDPIDDYFLKDKEEFLEKHVSDMIVPYAYIKDGKWFSKGEMGWFGISFNEISEEEYLKMFWDAFNSVPDDTMCYLYDCHI